MNRTLAGITHSTHFFTWIEDQECFGTIWELGYLYALGKKIYVGYAENISPTGDLWFMFQNLTAKKQFTNVDLALEWFFEQVES